MAHAPRQEPPAPPVEEEAPSGLRDIPGLSLRVGRHVTAWLLWHTARVSLIDDAQPPRPAELNRAARV